MITAEINVLIPYKEMQCCFENCVWAACVSSLFIDNGTILCLETMLRIVRVYWGLLTFMITHLKLETVIKYNSVHTKSALTNYPEYTQNFFGLLFHVLAVSQVCFEHDGCCISAQ